MSLSKSLSQAAVRGFVVGLAGSGYVAGSTSEEIETFRCEITRDDLFRGLEPTVVIENGVYVSGPYEGQSSSSLWLDEKESTPKTPANPKDVSP